MGSWRAILFLRLILVNIVRLTVSQPHFLNYYYISESGTYSTNSTYQKNLVALLSSLSNSTDKYGFNSSSVGENLDRVNAIVLCRGDVDLDTCRSCINNATMKLPQLLPNYKAAIGWYRYCMLRYSDKSINSILATNPSHFIYTYVNASSVNEFNQVLRSLLDGLRSKAALGGARRKFATNNTAGPDFQTIYGLMQCTPDLSEIDCNNCLQLAGQQIPHYFSGKTGGTILAPSCTLRYETYQFFTKNPADAPPATSAPPPAPPPARTFAPPPPSTDVTTKQVSGAGDQISIAELSQNDFDSISVATDNFSDSNKLGQGGFGAVYKGRLNGREIAVKRLDKESLQGETEFKNEVMILAKLQHKNLVRLLGFCSERTERLLIYEFVPQSSLDHVIFNPIRCEQLGWDKRYKIIRGISQGLLYLHEESQLTIIHRDLKAGNVLLDDDMNPKISDFGTARLFVVDKTHLSTINIAGTRGYMAPEYAVNGQFSIKSDVFSFGVLVLEILSGRKNKSFCNGKNVEGLLSYAWKSWREGTYSNVIDPTLRVNSGSMPEMIRCIHIGLLCVQESVAKRPAMAEVVLLLNSSSISLEVPSEPGFFLHSGSSNAELPLLQEHRSEFAVSGHSINEVSTTELYPR
ncbi:cysteine-rich receptor-like protein kinase 44 isoform X2 [Rhododendron vialii]|uniref:cysteine-rich receptor-like protein kinase 44 isoform X2 n=1 Tax=Rhododendron vialii TaxID=182163 RepID=UPI00265E9779|nr:cysteine-rich receptor-like protein kinase 44 isoform X2 [Rhododendron vialii]